MKTIVFIIFGLLFYTFQLQAQSIDTMYVKVDDIKLYTILSLPEEVADAPLVLIIGGSGPTDHNGNLPNMSSNSLLFLSNALVKKGIATARFDKRGIGNSAFPGLDESKLTIDRYAKDVELLMDYYRTLGFERIYIAGHSEGSLIGMIALQNKIANGFISLAGPGNSSDIILKNQLRPKLPTNYWSSAESIIDSLKQGKVVEQVEPGLYMLFRPSVQPYMISWFKYEPSELFKDTNCRKLVIQGDKDIQVPIEEAEKLTSLTPKAELIIINKMNHIFKVVEGGMQQNIATYSNSSLPIHEELSAEIVSFIQKQH